MAQQEAASPAQLTPGYPDPAVRGGRLRGKEPDFIQGFPSIFGGGVDFSLSVRMCACMSVVGAMCVFVGGRTSSLLRCVCLGIGLIFSVADTCGSLFMRLLFCIKDPLMYL